MHNWIAESIEILSHPFLPCLTQGYSLFPPLLSKVNASVMENIYPLYILSQKNVPLKGLVLESEMKSKDQRKNEVLHPHRPIL